MKTDGNVSIRERILGGLWGSLAGDALGVPVEFKDRATVQAEPVTDMREYGTHRQPRDTWSDDGAMILCTVDSLLNHEFNLDDMGSRFVRWLQNGLWTANGDVFDVGGTTCTALVQVMCFTPSRPASGACSLHRIFVNASSKPSAWAVIPTRPVASQADWPAS